MSFSAYLWCSRNPSKYTNAIVRRQSKNIHVPDYGLCLLSVIFNTTRFHQYGRVLSVSLNARPSLLQSPVHTYSETPQSCGNILAMQLRISFKETFETTAPTDEM